MFTALKIKNNDSEWTEWDEEIKQRDEDALKKVAATLTDEILYTEFEQYIFNVQWQQLHNYAKERGVQIFGDMPIFVAADSADVWANQKLSNLTRTAELKKLREFRPIISARQVNFGAIRNTIGTP